MHIRILAAAVVCAAAASTASAQPALSLSVLGSKSTGSFRDADPRNAEINAFDPIGKKIYVVNPQFGRLDVIDAQTPNALTQGTSLDLRADCAALLAANCPVAAAPASVPEPNSIA